MFYCLFKYYYIINVCFDVPWKTVEHLNNYFTSRAENINL